VGCNHHRTVACRCALSVGEAAGIRWPNEDKRSVTQVSAPSSHRNLDMSRVGPLKWALLALCVAWAAAAEEDPNQDIEIIPVENVLNRGTGEPVPEGTNLQGQVFYDYTNYGKGDFFYVLHINKI
jgi:hypothetical protein